jgi:uncharacterized membrane protein
VADDDEPTSDSLSSGRRNGARRLPLARTGFMEYDRVLFFSDAVIAIAITLLAVNLRVPAALGKIVHGRAVLTASHVLGEPHVRASLIGFGISFAAIGLFWLNHHVIFRYIIALDRTLIVLNLIFLGTIAFLPYPTQVLSGAGNDPGAVIFYALCVSAAGLAEGAVWLYANYARAGLTVPAVSEVRLHYTLRFARAPVVFLASIPIALTRPVDATYFWLLIPVTGVVISRLVPAGGRPRQAISPEPSD